MVTHGVSGVLARGECCGSWGTPVTRGAGKSGWTGMNNKFSVRELAKTMTPPITIRVREKGSRRITREFVVSSDLVFQPQKNGKYKLISTVDNFLRAVLTQ